MNKGLIEALRDAFNEARATARATEDMNLSALDLRAAFKADDEAVARFLDLLKGVGEPPERRPDGLRTPEQVAKDLGGISPSTIRTLIREGHIEYTPLARKKFALTDAQVDGMLAYLARKEKAKTEKARAPRAVESPFPSTSRSKASRRKVTGRDVE
ncbi:MULTISPECIES: hypothetical protein [Arthrobacter]|uniref:Helix-turn-helix domain-containing protein n=1 Tax=Arthrobacter terricola TaxID=2547396 RepID=A0A4R5L1C7_9MICC|nr:MULTISPECIES: hypothetical protein [Arthrobacter]MBT8159129.1 hypothetical protein [Arthrobacter sp. GN70]TDG01787.1 hypothetical protein E1809_01520 [Arthrobacter terricola]